MILPLPSMARIKLQLPATFLFETHTVVRVDDLNYGNHLSNDAYLKYMHEARLRFLANLGYSEFNLAGTSVIIGDTAIVFKGECFYGDDLCIEVTVGEIGTRSFDLWYRFTKHNKHTLICEAKTGMVCFNYQTHKTTDVPLAFKEKLTAIGWIMEE